MIRSRWRLAGKRSLLLIALLLVVIAVGAFLRFYRLGNSPIWGDQSILYSIALDFLNTGKLPLAANKSSAGVMNPPFVEYLIAAPLFVYRSLLSPLWFQAILSLLGIPIIFLVGAKILGKPAGLLAAAAYAISPWTVYYSRLIWNPSLVPFFTLLLLGSFLLYLTSARRLFLVLVFVWLAIVTQLHLSSLVLIPVLVVISVVFWHRFWRGDLWQTAIPIVLGLGLFFLLYLPYGIFERQVDFADIKILTGVLSGSDLSSESQLEGVVVNSASLRIALELAAGDTFIANQVATWREAVRVYPVLNWIARAMVAGGIVYGLFAPLLWRWRNRRERLPDYQVGLAVSGMWIAIPVILYLRHSHYLQNYFFLYLIPPALLVMSALWARIFELSRHIGKPFYRYLAMTAVVLSVLLLFLWQFSMQYTGLSLAPETEMLQRHSTGDLQTALDKLVEFREANSDCDIVLLAEGLSQDTSSIGMMEPFLYPAQVRLASAGRGFILPSGCGLYFVMDSDPLAQSVLDEQAERIDVMNSDQRTWSFYRLDGTTLEQLEKGEPAVRWSNGLSLLNSQVMGEFSPGQRITLTYQWRVERPSPFQDYHFFSHLLDGDGQLVAQIDGASVHPVYWREGDWLINQFHLDLPTELAPGEYTLQLGMYTWPDIVRVQLAGSEETTLEVANWPR